MWFSAQLLAPDYASAVAQAGWGAFSTAGCLRRDQW